MQSTVIWENTMRIDILTLSRDVCFAAASQHDRPRQTKRAPADQYRKHQDFALDKHQQVDDYPYGGVQGWS
jgi:tRNA G37 N-methylase TrmD